jgi:NADH-quinone oxidoreductase subunit L
MFRLLILTFFGEARYTNHDVHHVHESPATMLIPLVILAIGSIGGGYLNIPGYLGFESAESASSSVEHLLMAASIAAALTGLVVAWLFYVARPEWPARIASGADAFYSILTHKYYIDEVYDAIIVLPLLVTSREFLWKIVDTLMIDGTVNGIGQLIRSSADGLRHMQSGYVRTYAAWILAGGVLVIAWFLR